MIAKIGRCLSVVALFSVLVMGLMSPVLAAAEGGHGETSGGETGGGNAFAPHQGTWFNGIARRIFGGEVHAHKVGDETHFTGVTYDYIVVAFFLMGLLAIVTMIAARRMKVRPEGKPHSIANSVEAAVDGFQNYLIGVMGEKLARKYAPLIASFFFTILIFNYAGLIPGLLAPTSNPNVPFSLAIVSFFMVHVIAIREAGFKSWIMHFVGEPVWMAPLMFPLHVIGELVKPVSLALRLLGNVFGEEVVIAKIAGLAIAAGVAFGLPTFLPLQLPIMLLSVFFGLLQAMVFSTLLAIYIAILSTHHDEHDVHNAHGDVEHVTVGGHRQLVAHPAETTIA